MKFNTFLTVRISIIAFAALLFLGCGEDRTHEFYEKTEENQWIFSQMKDNYMWSDSIVTPERNSFFGNSSDFYYGLLYKNDNTSYFTDSASSTTYGMNFAVMRDPLGIRISKSYALVLFVEPGSSAEKAGIKRGTWISRVGNRDITLSNYGYLERGDATTLCTWSIEFDDESIEYMWVAGDTLDIESATAVDSNPVYLDSIYEVRNHKIGYIVYNRFETTESTQKSIESVLSWFGSNNITELILDLRYNSGGSAGVAASLAGHFVTADAIGKTFCEIKRNEQNSDKNAVYAISGAEPLETGAIYILTTAATRGIAEAFASSLQEILGNNKIIIVGENTAGDNLYTETIASPYTFSINPTIGQLYTSNGNILSPHGVHANYTVNELAQLNTIYQLGEEQEYLLYNTFYLIINGTLPYTSANTTNDTPMVFGFTAKGRSIIK